MGDDGRQHSVELHVLGERGGTAHFLGDVGAGQALGPADVLEILRILELHVGRRGDGGRPGRERAEVGLALGPRVAHDAVLDRDLAGRHLPLGRGGRHQHGAGSSAGLPELLPGVGDGAAAAGALRPAPLRVAVALRVRRRALDLHAAPVGVELLGDDRGEAGVAALAHLEMLGDHRHRAVVPDAQERVGLEGRSGRGRLRALPGGLRRPAAGQIERQRQRGPGGRAYADEIAAGDFARELAGRGHAAPPSAAVWIAFRMRW